MTEYSAADKMHRLIKQALDSGSAASLEEAEAQFLQYRICFVIGDREANDRNCQAALLTGVALATRVFLGGVDVVGNLDAPLRVPMPLGDTLKEAVFRLGGRPQARIDSLQPCVFVGAPAQERTERFAVRMVFRGWRAGVVPAHVHFEEGESFIIAIAPMLSAALAVNEAFAHVQGKTPTAGRRALGLSLWNLRRVDWLKMDRDAPPVQYLPSSLWLIGLGHLGQAYLWALGLLPYPDQSEPSLVLQDIDTITPSTFSTSILSEVEMAGHKKTRKMAEWAEQRGFKTVINERRFDHLCERAVDEPAIALCGLDNALGRQALDRAGFPLVIEAGLGRGHRDFKTMRLHTLPSTRPSHEIWKASVQREDLSGQAAYQKMLSTGELDRCGATLLAGRAVGAPFVGAVAACLAVAEVLRLLQGGNLHELIDLDLQSLDQRYLVTQKHDFGSFNPGYIRAAA